MGVALYSHSLKLALEHDLPTPALRAYNNLGDSLGARDRYEEALAYHENGIALARRVGNRQWEWQLLIESTFPLIQTGRWDEALERVSVIPDPDLGALGIPPVFNATIYVARGDVVEARRFVSLIPHGEHSTDRQARATHASINAVVLRADGRHAEALAAGKSAFEARHHISATHQSVKLGFVEAVEAAFALGDVETVKELLAAVDAFPPGEVAPFMRAQTTRSRARLAAAEGLSERVEPGFKTAASIFREFGVPFWRAVTELEHSEWLGSEGRAAEAEPFLAEARETFEALGATPWLERAEPRLETAEATA